MAIIYSICNYFIRKGKQDMEDRERADYTQTLMGAVDHIIVSAIAFVSIFIIKNKNGQNWFNSNEIMFS